MRSNRWSLALGLFNPVALVHAVHAVDTVTVHIPTGTCLPGAYTGLGGSGLPTIGDSIYSIYGTYSLQGCYDASAGGYVVTSVTTNTSLTLEGCAASCIGSSYLAVANGNTCVCASSGPTGAGVDIGQYGCMTTCTGNSSQCCGSTRYGLVYHCPTCKSASGSSTAITLTTTDSKGSTITSTTTSALPSSSSSTTSSPSTSIVVFPTTDSAGSSTTSSSTSTITPSSTSSTSAVVVITSTGTVTTTDSIGSSITSVSTVTTSSTKTGGRYSTAIPTSHASCQPGIYEDALGQVYEIYCGADIPGKDLLTPHKDSFADCLLECDRYVPSATNANNAACIGVSYGYGNVGGNCYLKYEIDSFNTGNGGFDSARMIGYNPPSASSISLSPSTAGPSLLPSVIAPVSSIVGEVTSAVVAPVTSVVGEVTSVVVAPVTSIVGEVSSAVIAPVNSILSSAIIAPVSSAVIAPVSSILSSAIIAPVSSAAIAPVSSILSSAVIAPVSSAVVAPVSSILSTAVVAPVSSAVIAPVSSAVIAPVSSAVVAPVSSAVIAPVSSVLSTAVPAPVSSVLSSAIIAPVASVSVPIVSPIGGLGGGGGVQQTSTGPAAPVDSAALSFPCPAFDAAQYIDSNGETYVVECNAQYPGSDLPAVHMDAFKDCITACDAFVPNNYGSCIGVSWGAGNVGGNCYFKYAITETRYNDQGFNSAHKVSYQKPGQSNTPVAPVPQISTTRLPISNTPVILPPASSPPVVLPPAPIGGGGLLGGGGGQTTTSQTPASTPVANQGPGPTPTITTITGCPGNNNTRYSNALGTQYDVHCGFELVGRNGKPVHADTFEKCLEFCDILRGCGGVTYLDPPPPAIDSNCYPYSEVTGFSAGREGVFTGVPTAGPTTSTIGTGVLCPGTSGGTFTDVFGETYRIGCGFDIGGDNLYATQTWTLQGCLTYCSTYNTCQSVVFVGQENPPVLPADQNANCYPRSSITSPPVAKAGSLLAVNTRFVPAGFKRLG